MSLQNLITKLKLIKHPEGGYYRRTYASPERLSTDSGERSAMTGIYYCLPNGEFSAFHRIKSFERWFYHAGNIIDIYLIENRQVKVLPLGPIEEDAELVVDIPANTWFAARPKGIQAYALASCVVCPGFSFDDFELADKRLLKAVDCSGVELVASLLGGR